MEIATTYNDPEVSAIIWPTFKVSLDEKHPGSGAAGLRGESFALKLIVDDLIYGPVRSIIHHEDCVFQLLGSDITVWTDHEGPQFIDVKYGGSALYYDPKVGDWFITLRQSVLEKQNKTDHILHIGPKGDVYATYNKRAMNAWLEHKNKTIDGEYKHYRKHWDYNIIGSNLL